MGGWAQSSQAYKKTVLVLFPDIPILKGSELDGAPHNQKGLDHRSWCDHWQRPPRYIGGGPPTSH